MLRRLIVPRVLNQNSKLFCDSKFVKSSIRVFSTCPICINPDDIKTEEDLKFYQHKKNIYRTEITGFNENTDEILNAITQIENKKQLDSLISDIESKIKYNNYYNAFYIVVGCSQVILFTNLGYLTGFFGFYPLAGFSLYLTKCHISSSYNYFNKGNKIRKCLLDKSKSFDNAIKINLI